ILNNVAVFHEFAEPLQVVGIRTTNVKRSCVVKGIRFQNDNTSNRTIKVVPPHGVRNYIPARSQR
ncbi:MAG: hypothetical protein ACKVKV_07150, partial [Dehalococcoidia bacterium]